MPTHQRQQQLDATRRWRDTTSQRRRVASSCWRVDMLTYHYSPGMSSPPWHVINLICQHDYTTSTTTTCQHVASSRCCPRRCCVDMLTFQHDHEMATWLPSINKLTTWREISISCQVVTFCWVRHVGMSTQSSHDGSASSCLRDASHYISWSVLRVSHFSSTNTCLSLDEQPPHPTLVLIMKFNPSNHPHLTFNRWVFIWWHVPVLLWSRSRIIPPNHQPPITCWVW